MASVLTCTTPKEGWALVGHFIGNLVPLIGLYGEVGEDEKEEGKNKRERVIYDSWTKLAGNLYMVVRRMKSNGHDEEAAKMQQLLDMVTDFNLTDREVRKAVIDKYEELDAVARGFTEELARLRAEHKLQ